MAWFWTIIQLLIRLSASFWSYDMKMLHGIWYKLGDWIKRYLIWTYHRLSQEYFKAYIIAFSVALWLDLEQLSSYLFVYRRFYRAAISNVTWNLIQSWRIEWRYLIQTYHRLSQKYLKSYREGGFMAYLNNYPVTFGYLFQEYGGFQQISYLNLPQVINNLAFSVALWLFVALWLDLEQLSSYLFVYRRFYRAAISKCYMEFDTKLENWINRYLIQTYHRLSQKYFKSYR